MAETRPYQQQNADANQPPAPESEQAKRHALWRSRLIRWPAPSAVYNRGEYGRITQSEMKATTTRDNTLELAVKIVEKGVKAAINPSDYAKGDPRVGPVWQIGDMTLIDHRDIASMRGMYKIMKSYLLSDNSWVTDVPLSMAVFGPPGSGKSFGIKQIAKDINPSLIESVTFNLSQMQTLDHLTDAFIRVRDISMNRKIPLVFFDEFDSEFNDKPLGWLKHFLAPMQDGTFRRGETDLTLGKSIYVFAGGTSASFVDFVRSGHIKEEKQRSIKLPDFVSRLKGHIDILSLSYSNHPHEIGPIMLRRATLIRSILCRAKLADDKKKMVMVNKRIILALLRVAEYRHGARSIESIVKMCTPHSGSGHIELSSLPSRHLLNMHVDADEFFELAYSPLPDFERKNRRVVRK